MRLKVSKSKNAASREFDSLIREQPLKALKF